MVVGMLDKYDSYEALVAGGEIEGTDFDITVRERPKSPVLIVAPHGGSIENGTSEIAALIAGVEYSLFTFNGLKERGRNRDLHITSHNFDHPACVALASRHSVVLAVHGCRGESSQIYVGGRDAELTTLLTERLVAAGLPATSNGHKYPGLNPLNICNRSARGKGAQLEFTLDLRDTPARTMIVPIVRNALSDYLARL
jgi:phage replication-related protein YjqB (UPF0714/DUF867 family)